MISIICDTNDDGSMRSATQLPKRCIIMIMIMIIIMIKVMMMMMMVPIIKSTSILGVSVLINDGACGDIKSSATRWTIVILSELVQ